MIFPFCPADILVCRTSYAFGWTFAGECDRIQEKGACIPMMTKNEYCLEACVDSFASAMAAVDGGATRLELCSALIVGGLTPDVALLRQIHKETNIPIRCLIRPRFGDFLYSDREVELMEQQIVALVNAGAEGVVIGCLTPEGELNEEQMTRLIIAAQGSGVTMHRAFDVCRDGLKTAKRAAALGVDTILTSGQQDNCWSGREYIGMLLAQNLPLTIMAGGGVGAGVIGDLLKIYPLRAFHMSGKVTLNSGMVFRREGVPMGLPGLDEFSVWQTDAEKIRQAATVLAGHYR